MCVPFIIPVPHMEAEGDVASPPGGGDFPAAGTNLAKPVVAHKKIKSDGVYHAVLMENAVPETQRCPSCVPETFCVAVTCSLPYASLVPQLVPQLLVPQSMVPQLNSDAPELLACQPVRYGTCVALSCTSRIGTKSACRPNP